MKEDHDRPDDLLLGSGVRDALGSNHADARHVNRLQSLTPSFSDNSTRCRADRRSDPTPNDSLGGVALNQQRISKLMGAIVSLVNRGMHAVEPFVVGERSE